MGPVFEYLALLLQAVQVFRFESIHSIPKRVYMRARDNRQRIQLHISQVSYCSESAAGPTTESFSVVQALVVKHQFAGIGWGNRNLHSQKYARVAKAKQGSEA